MRPTLSVNEVIVVMAVLTFSLLPVTVTAQQGGGRAWAIGFMVEYASVGGYQLHDVDDGVGATVFVSRRMKSVLTLEVGLSASLHQVPTLVVYGSSNSSPGTDVFGTFYVRSTVRFPSKDLGVTPYLGIQVGLTGGSFTNTFSGLQGGGSGGVIFPLGERFDFAIGVTASMVYVRPFQGRIARTTSGWGRMLVLRSGMVVRLGR